MGLPDYLVPVQDRKPHLMHATFFDRIKKCTAAAFSTMFVNTICVLEDAVKLDMHDFQPPLLNISLKTWGEYAKKKSHHHALFLVLEHFYETLKLLMISWDEHQDIALIYLQMMKVDSAIQSHRQHQAISAIKDFLETQERIISLGRLKNLYKVLNEKLQDHGQDFCCILFAKQGLTTHILKYAIESHILLGKGLKRNVYILPRLLQQRCSLFQNRHPKMHSELLKKACPICLYQLPLLKKVWTFQRQTVQFTLMQWTML